MMDDMGHGQRIPDDYKLAGQWQLQLKGWTLVILLVVGAAAFGLTMVLGLAIRVLLRGPLEGTVSIALGGVLFVPVVLGVLVAFVVAHEAVHGVLFLVFGGKPRFGAKVVGRFLPVAFYASSGAPVLTNQYLLLTLAPFLLLTPVFLLIGILANGEAVIALAMMAAAMNASGSIPDLLAAGRIRRNSRETLFKDTETGFNWYLPTS